MNPGTNQVQTSTVQTLDIYGNVTQQQVYDYGSSTPTHTYNYTYLTGSNYVPNYIRNRLTQATVTSSAGTITQQTISYDGTNVGYLTGQNGLTFSDPAFHNSNCPGPCNLNRGNPTSVNQMGTILGYGYYATGIPYQIVDGDGATVSLSNSSSTAYSLPDSLTPNSNSGYATNMAYSASSFALASVSGPNGATQTTTYDAYNRPSTVTSVDGAVTTYTYAYNPNTLTASLSSPSTQWTATTYDGFGRTIKVQSGYGAATNVVSTVDTQYGPCGGSPLGVVTQVSEPYGPGQPEYWTTYTYDGSCRRLAATKTDLSATTNVYAGNSTTVTDPAGKYKTYTKDAFGNLTSVVEPNPGGSGALPTNYTYNAANQLTGVTMTRTVSGVPVTQTRSFTWSGSDLVSSTNPENGTVNYQYDGNHHVTNRTDALGHSTTYEYDGYERLGFVTHSADGRIVHYYYDGTTQVNACANSNLQNTTGRLSLVTFTNGNSEPTYADQQRSYGYQYGYNTAGRVTQQTFVNYSGTLCASYNWDNQGRPTSITTPGGTVLNYQYDP